MAENIVTTTTSEQEITKEQFEQEKEICSMYIDCAKTYTQSSIGALLLSITFFSDIIGIATTTTKENPMLLVLWSLWLLAILFGVTYQYCVVKYLETIADEKKMLAFKRTWTLFLPKKFKDTPYVLYGIMVILFYTGILLFSILAFIAVI